MRTCYILNNNINPLVKHFNHQKRFINANSRLFIGEIINYNKNKVFNGFNNYTRFCCSTNLLSLNPRCFSTLVKPEVSIAEGGLYAQTARPFENFKVDAGVTTPSEGLKSCRIFDNPNIIRVRREGRETLFDKLYRYLDITGFFTMLNSRKAHILRTPPEARASIMCSTEFERRQSLLLNGLISILLFYMYGCFIHHKIHIYDRHPSPEMPTFEFTGNRTKDFTWHGSFPFQYPKGRCKECRWLEMECKKRCYDDLVRQDHKFIIHKPMQIPRRQLLPSPYPPAD